MGGSQQKFNSYTTAEQAIDNVDLKDKICIVTGCNTGIGKETARVLAMQNATVIMACRSVDRGNEALKDITNNLKGKNNFNENLLKVYELDLSSLQSVSNFAAKFKQDYKSLHYLINNAGVMAMSNWEPTKDGYEMQFGTNHIGHFYLTMLLTEMLIQSKPSRVINVASDAHKYTPNNFINQIRNYIKNEDGPPKDTYSPWGNYGISKSSNILFAREYNRRYQSLGVSSVSLHPGVIPTDLSRNLPSWMASALKSRIARPFLKTIEQGAATTVRCVSLSDSELQGGHYYKDCNEANADLQQQWRITSDYNKFTDVKNEPPYLLWQLSVNLITKKNFPLSEGVDKKQEDKTEEKTEEKTDEK